MYVNILFHCISTYIVVVPDPVAAELSHHIHLLPHPHYHLVPEGQGIIQHYINSSENNWLKCIESSLSITLAERSKETDFNM